MGKFFDNTEALFSYDYQSSKNKIDSFPMPKDDIDRSVFQYLCTMSRMPLYKRIVLNIASLIVFLPYYILMRLKNVGLKKVHKFDAVFFTDRISEDTIPNSLRKKYKEIVCVKYGEHMSLDKIDSKFVWNIVLNRPFSPYFNLKVMMKIGMISSCIRCYEPQVIIHYSESSFATSIASHYCEEKKISYIGIMHGERLFSLKLPFFRCTEYYAWDEDYVALLKSMRCEESQFRVEVPQSLILPDYSNTKNPRYDYTFYLQIETDDSLQKLKKVLVAMKNRGYNLSIRPHPLSDMAAYNSSFGEYNIEDPRMITLKQSFMDTKYVVSKFSTVLYQAWYLGIDIVIDDYTVPDLYRKLNNLGYVMIKKPHRKLSEIMREVEI
jgi:hypothetical protein